MSIIVANWKMNKTLSEALLFASEIKKAALKEGRKVIIAPPFILLHPLEKELKDTGISLAAQNMFFEESGAFTGEISPMQLLDASVEYVIIGHSERRHIFREDNEFLAKKLKSALSHSLIPIFCIGETLEERKSGKTCETVEKQLREGLNLISEEDIKNIIFAYEPVWAIGTGITATPEQAEEVHCYIKDFLQKKYLKSDIKNVRILYGGSVTPENATSLMAMDNIDGLLVGGASLKVESFVRIINF